MALQSFSKSLNDTGISWAGMEPGVFEAVGGGAFPRQPGSPRPCSRRHHPAPKRDRCRGMRLAGPILLLGAVIAGPDTPRYAQAEFLFLFFPPVFFFGSYVNPSFPSVGITPCNYEAAGSLHPLNWSCCFPDALFLANYAVFGQLPSILTDWLPILTDSAAWAALIPYYLWKWCCVTPRG